MEYLNSVRAALNVKGAAPVIAIPVPGHSPICVRAKLLKGALKGVKIHSVSVLEGGWLKIFGMAEGGSSPFMQLRSHEPLQCFTHD